MTTTTANTTEKTVTRETEETRIRQLLERLTDENVHRLYVTAMALLNVQK